MPWPGGELYQAFDKFLATPWWDKRNPSDEKRFYIALHKVVRNPDFGAESMRHYMLEKFQLNQIYDAADIRVMAIGHYTELAQAVRDYLDYNHLL